MTDDSLVKVGVVQAAAVVGDIEGNLKALRSGVESAARIGAELVVTPELFATGYDPAGSWYHDGAAIRDRLGAIAHELGVAIVASTVDERNSGAGARRYIAASFFGASGEEIARVHKRHLYDIERDYFLPGESYGEIVRWRGLNFGVGICYDIEFPEFGRSLAEAGAEILLIPTAVPVIPHNSERRDHGLNYSAKQTSTLLVPARALENGVAIVYANHCGVGFTGHSCIVNPFGRCAEMIEAESGVAVVELGAADIAEARALNPYLSDLERLRDQTHQ